MTQVRPAAVAGLFYPADPAALADAIEGCWGDRVIGAVSSRVMVVPHAGLPYSGPVAATAYGALEGGKCPSRAWLLGPPHRVPVSGVAAVSTSAFATPLGTLAIDYPQWLWARPQICVSDAAHRAEHSLEVQLPFLQRLWGNAVPISPLLVGDADAGVVADIIDSLLQEPDALLLVSSDLSHFHDYQTACRVDAVTVAALEACRAPLGPEQACGCRALNGLIEFCSRVGAGLQALDVRNSGDTAGDRARVVGYAALALR